MQTINVKTICPLCETEHLITVDKEQYERYQKGELIQNCFPEMKPEIREMLITGICPECWDKYIDIEEDEI